VRAVSEVDGNLQCRAFSLLYFEINLLDTLKILPMFWGKKPLLQSIVWTGIKPYDMVPMGN
jgi:hypothetical protein